MAERSWFFNAEQISEGKYDREYLAEDFAKYFSLFISNGVFPNPSTGLQVVAADTPDMTVTLKPGYAFINGYVYENTSDYIFSIDVADGVLDRIDCIFIRFYLADRTIKTYKEAGNASSEPSPGDLIRTEDYWDLCVAQIKVEHGVTAITQSAITDTRLDTDLCGIVHSVVDHIDTKTLYTQIQTDLAEFKNVSQEEFNAWFEAINRKLGDEPATALQQQIDRVNENITKMEGKLSYLYEAKYLLDEWKNASAEEKQKGWMYKQTVSVSAIDADAPAVTAETEFLPQIGCNRTGVAETDEKLQEALNIINESDSTTGNGTITTLVKEKPTVDIPVIWVLRSEVQ